MSSVKKTGIGGAVGIAIGLIATAFQWKYPEYKGLANALLVAAGVILYTALVVWLVQVLAARKHEQQLNPAPPPSQHLTQRAPITNVFAPTLNQSQSHEQTQAVSAKVSIPPEIECTDCYFAEERLSAHWNRLGEANGRPCSAAMANFYLKPLPGADPWIELRTHLVFYGPNETRLQRVPDGMWKEPENIIQMPMRTGDTRTLVIAIEFDDIGFTTYEYHEEPSRRTRFTTTGIYHHFLQPTLTPLSENALTVKVNLVGKYLDEVKLNQDFWFNLTRPDMTIKQIAAPQFKPTS